MILVIAMLLSLLPATALATEKGYVYLSVSFDGKYINDKHGNPIVYLPVSMDAVSAVDLQDYGLDNMLFDADGDGDYETTALQLLIYAHEELYGGDWSEVSFDAIPGSSYFKGGIFGFTENLVYFLNGDFPVDESQQSDFMTVGATSDRIVLKAGDFLDVASFGCFSFLWDQMGGFHLFADSYGNYIHDYTVTKGETLDFKLMHSFCDLMFGQAWVKDATDYEVYYGKTFGEAEGSILTDDSGCGEITFPYAGTYYLWCDGAPGSDDGTHSACDHYFENMEPCIVSSPAYAKVTVTGEETKPVLESGWKMGHTLNLASDISVTFAMQKSALNGFDMDTVYILAERDIYEGNVKTGVKTVEIRPEDKGSYYSFTLNGLTAVNMNDVIRSVLYGTKDGQVHSSPVDEYSIATYAYAQMNKTAATLKLKTLCAELLRYGAKAQIFKGYRTDSLADANMTGVQKAYLSDLEAVEFHPTNTVLNDAPNAPMKWEGKALDLASKVSIKFIFSMGSYTGKVEDLTLKVSYEGVDGTAKTLTLQNGELYHSKYNFYAFTLDTLLAAELRSVLSVQIFEGETPVSSTLQYAAETYGENKTGALGELCKALFAYSDSALIYFAES